MTLKVSNKAEYTAKDAPITRLREGVTDLRTDRRTDSLHRNIVDFFTAVDFQFTEVG